MKTQVMSIKDFMKYEKEPFSVKVERHFKKYGKVYKVAGLTMIVLSTGNIVSAMMDPTAVPVAAVSGGTLGIEPAARQLYRQLVGIGKWIIIFKGGFDTIKNIGAGDFDAAKKNFFAYLLTYLFLIALPYGMDQVEKIGISASGQ